MKWNILTPPSVPGLIIFSLLWKCWWSSSPAPTPIVSLYSRLLSAAALNGPAVKRSSVLETRVILTPYMSRISRTNIRCLFNKSMNLLLICRFFINVILFISLFHQSWKKGWRIESDKIEEDNLEPFTAYNFLLKILQIFLISKIWKSFHQ